MNQINVYHPCYQIAPVQNCTSVQSHTAQKPGRWGTSLMTIWWSALSNAVSDAFFASRFVGTSRSSDISWEPSFRHLRATEDRKRPLGRIRTTRLMRTVESDFQPANTGVRSAWRRAQDRASWRQPRCSHAALLRWWWCDGDISPTRNTITRRCCYDTIPLQYIYLHPVVDV